MSVAPSLRLKCWRFPIVYSNKISSTIHLAVLGSFDRRLYIQKCLSVRNGRCIKIFCNVFFRIQSSGTHFENCNLFSFSSWPDLFSLSSFQFFKSSLIIEIMLSNIPVTSLVLLFSVLLTVNTSPVPKDNALALLDLVARQHRSLLGRDIDWSAGRVVILGEQGVLVVAELE